MKDSELVRVLNIEECSVRLVAGDRETVSVLIRATCSPRFETLFSEPVNVLNIEECSTGTTEKPNEPDSVLVKPLTSEPVKDNDPVSDLVSEACSVIADDVLIEPVNSSTRPRDRVIASPSEPPRALPIPLVWELTMERDPVRDLTNPLLSEPAREIEPKSVLENVPCSTTLAETVNNPVSVLERPECSIWLEVTVNEPVKALKIEECSTKAADKLNEPERLLAKALLSEPVKDNEPASVLNSEA